MKIDFYLDCIVASDLFGMRVEMGLARSSLLDTWQEMPTAVHDPAGIVGCIRAIAEKTVFRYPNSDSDLTGIFLFQLRLNGI